MTTILASLPRQPSSSSSDSGEELIPIRRLPAKRLPRPVPRPVPDDYDPHQLQVYEDLDFLGRRQRKASESPPRFPETAQTLPTPLLHEPQSEEHRTNMKPPAPPFLISPDPLKDTNLPAPKSSATHSQPRLRTKRESDLWVRHGSAEMRVRPIESLPGSQKNSRLLSSPKVHTRKKRIIKKKLIPLAVNRVGDLMGAYLGSSRSARLLRTAAGGRFRS